VFNFDGAVTDIRTYLFCGFNCPTDMQAILYDTNGVEFERGPLLPYGSDGSDLGFQRVDTRPCKKMVVTAPSQMPPDTWTGGVWAFLYMDYNPMCPVTDDSVLNDPGVRHVMNQEWNNSNGEGKERGGWIYQDLSSGAYMVQLTNDVPRDRCSIQINPIPQAIPGYTPVRWFHTHIIPRATPRSALAADCPYLPQRFVSGNGPGGRDQVISDQSQKPGLVIDNDEVFKQFPIDPLTGIGGAVLHWDWVDNCRMI
jgi:hypothetical protein